MTATDTIQTRPQDTCPYCGERGRPLFQDLRDKLFGVPGKWNVERCNNRACRSVWMNPTIIEADLYKAYRSYFTHGSSPSQNPKQAATATPANSSSSSVEDNYLAMRFGYQPVAGRAANKWLGWMAYLRPNKRTDLDLQVMYLPAVKNGRVLDVGCGNGSRLDFLRKRGWQVQGVDLDAEAIAEAKRRGIPADRGDLRSLNYPINSFDAVILSHVIEHVPSPGDLLSECARLLKPGGRLALVTPNSDSFGLSFYGRCWRGLEPPRHLQVATLAALEGAVEKAGLRVITGKTVNGPYILQMSQAFKTKAALNNGSTTLDRGSTLFVKGLTLLEFAALCVRPGRGEMLIVVGEK